MREFIEAHDMQPSQINETSNVEIIVCQGLVKKQEFFITLSKKLEFKIVVSPFDWTVHRFE